MARFEDAIQYVMNGGRARRQCWARVPAYTQATPPIAYERMWRIWSSEGSIIQGWGGQIGFELSPDERVRDGALYAPSDADRLAADWELIK